MLGSVVEEPTERYPVPRVMGRVDGRADAFRQLVDRDLDASYRLAAVIRNDRVEAEDAVHDAAIVAWQRWGDLRDKGRFDAWFRRILVNGCRDRLRARARHRVVDLAAHDVLARALDLLQPEEQVLITLRYSIDLTVPAIATAMGVPEGTVKSRLHHALGRLRVALQEGER